MAIEQQSFREGVRQSTGGYDMVLAVVLFTFLGLWLDRRFELVPILTITFALLAVVGSVANTYYKYQRTMDEIDAERLAKQAGDRSGGEAAS
jgi:F0F1-type ATP synthase assembly protein I